MTDQELTLEQRERNLKFNLIVAGIFAIGIFCTIATFFLIDYTAYVAIPVDLVVSYFIIRFFMKVFNSRKFPREGVAVTKPKIPLAWDVAIIFAFYFVLINLLGGLDYCTRYGSVVAQISLVVAPILVYIYGVWRMLQLDIARKRTYSIGFSLYGLSSLIIGIILFSALIMSAFCGG
jgi:hypothetical protein